MPFTAALSEHPVAADAVGEVLGDVIEQRGVAPDLAVLFLSPHHCRFVREITNAVRTLLRPRTLLGCTADATIAGAREVEDGPSLSLWAGWLGTVAGVRVDVHRVDAGIGLSGLDPDTIPEGGTVLLLADPFSFPTEAFVDELHHRRPDVAVVGGLASGARTPGGNALVLDDLVANDGAVGAVLRPSQVVGPVVSQGCRPVGAPMVVTEAQGNLLQQLAGEPALDRLERLVEQLPPDERSLLGRGVHLGIVIDESRSEFGPGDFLVRNVLGADRNRRVIAVGAPVEVGRTVQFHVRDADAATEELVRLLDGVHGPGALLFTCTGRGSHLFDQADHDAGTVRDLVGPDGLAGMSCAGEIGPVGGRSFVHGFTASVLVLDDQEAAAGASPADGTAGPGG